MRMGKLKLAKPLTGMGTKPDDAWTTPLCNEHHRMQHGGSEATFWANHKIDPFLLALALWQATGDMQRMEIIARMARNP